MANRYQYSQKSLDKLETCHDALKAVATRALEISPVDITIVHGYRDKHIQDELYATGASQKPYPESKHNHTDKDGRCSLAIDVAPWANGTIDWEDTHMFALLAGVFFAAAIERGVELRWGGDWNMNNSTEDQSFMDWGHFELVGYE